MNLGSKIKGLQPNLDSIEEKLASIRDSVYSVSLEVLGPANRHHQVWFNENDSDIYTFPKGKHRLLCAQQNEP
jgi:hypothetical protein